MKKSMVRTALLSSASLVMPAVSVILIPSEAAAQTVCTGNLNGSVIDIECTDGADVVVIGTTESTTTFNGVPQGLSLSSAGNQTTILNPGPDGDTITTTADGAAGIGITSSGGLTLTASDVNVSTSGDSLVAVLPQAHRLLGFGSGRPHGGRLITIAFHSLEDRIVKQYLQRESSDCVCPP